MNNSFKQWIFIAGGIIALLAIDNLVVFKYILPNRFGSIAYNSPSPVENSSPSTGVANNAPTTPTLSPASSTSNCTILPQVYCDTGKLISYPAGSTYSGGSPSHVAFSLPAGTNVYLPFDVDRFIPAAKYVNIGGEKYQVSVADSKDGRYYISIVGKLDEINLAGAKKGDYLGKINGAAISAAGNYDLIITFVDTNSSNSADLNLTRQYFPNL